MRKTQMATTSSPNTKEMNKREKPIPDKSSFSPVGHKINNMCTKTTTNAYAPMNECELCKRPMPNIDTTGRLRFLCCPIKLFCAKCTTNMRGCFNHRDPQINSVEGAKTCELCLGKKQERKLLRFERCGHLKFCANCAQKFQCVTSVEVNKQKSTTGREIAK